MSFPGLPESGVARSVNRAPVWLLRPLFGTGPRSDGPAGGVNESVTVAGEAARALPARGVRGVERGEQRAEQRGPRGALAAVKSCP